MYSDFTMHHAQLGTHVEVLEMDDLQVRVSGGPAARRSKRKSRRYMIFSTLPKPGRDKISQPVTDEAMQWSAKVAVGLDKLVKDFDLNGLTYYYRGLNGNEFRGAGRGADRRQLAAHGARHPGVR